MNKKAVIFGAGEWGKIAYYYYVEDIEIAYYVDNDKTIWGTQINGITISSPEILRNQNYTVIIANKRFEDEIKEQLLHEFFIHNVVIFRIDEKMQELSVANRNNICKDELIIAFSNGLGNQMFQYALYKNFLKQGKNVKADLSAYIKPGMMPFELTNFFSNIELTSCTPELKEYYLKEGKEWTYIEEPPRNKEKITYSEKMLKMQVGYIEGFHCSYMYPEMIRQELLHDFLFSWQNDKKLSEIKSIIESKEMVGVHVRRGDFLKDKFKREIGSICTKEFYLKAINRIKKICPNVSFCFFSNDINWVKENLVEGDSLYINKSIFSEYYDWYDMYLMSICKHNIIPNSTFGWWGAWLNQNSNKIVIAPKIWRSRWNATDWCPPEWILI